MPNPFSSSSINGPAPSSSSFRILYSAPPCSSFSLSTIIVYDQDSPVVPVWSCNAYLTDFYLSIISSYGGEAPPNWRAANCAAFSDT